MYVHEDHRRVFAGGSKNDVGVIDDALQPLARSLSTMHC